MGEGRGGMKGTDFTTYLKRIQYGTEYTPSQKVFWRGEGVVSVEEGEDGKEAGKKGDRRGSAYIRAPHHFVAQRVEEDVVVALHDTDGVVGA